MAIVRLLKPHVGRVVIAHPLQVRVIAEAKAKTDRIDAAALARLHAAGYLPVARHEGWPVRDSGMAGRCARR